MENGQQPPININLDGDNTQQVRLSKAELNAGMEFLRAAGFDPTTPAQNAGSGAATATSSGVTDAIEAMGKDIADKMQEFSQRLTLLETRSAGPSADTSADHPSFDTSTPNAPKVLKDGDTTPAPSQQPLPWSERPLDETPDYNLQLSWDDEDLGDESSATSNLFSISENTSKLLQDSFLKAIPNPARKQLREKHGDPRCPPTRVPKLDKMVRDRMSQGAVKLDRSLTRLQALCVDAVGPLASLVELAERNQLTAEGAVALSKLALRFVGNASIQFSRERRKRAIEEMNGKLVELAEKDSIYEKAAPMLFGDEFAKEAKEREDQLRALDRATNRSNFHRPQNFQGRRPHGFHRGGGTNPSRQGYQSQFGAGRGRFRPYQFRTAFRGKENFAPRGRGKTQ
jgi:hypothetical protein